MTEYVVIAPRGWPEKVPPPGAEGWQERAVAWLLDRAAPGWRRYTDFWRAHPQLLARLVLQERWAVVPELRRGYSTTRVDFKDQLEPHQVEQILEWYATEGPRAVAEARQVQLVCDALHGVRWRPTSALPGPVPPRRWPPDGDGTAQ